MRHGRFRGIGIPVAVVAVVASVLVPGAPPASAAVGAAKVSVGAASVVEGDVGTRRVFFAVTLSRPRASATSVAFATQSGTAVAGADFVGATGTVTVPAGATSASIVVLVKGNTVINAGTRSFTVVLSSPVGASLGQGTATGTIRDDDAAPSPRVSIGSASVVAGNAETTVALAVTLSKPVAALVSVAFATRAATAKDGTDFVGRSGRVTIAAGTRSSSIIVRIRGNGGTRGGAVETFTVRLSVAIGASIDRGTGTGTIRRDGYGTAGAWTQLGGEPGLTGYAKHENTLSTVNVTGVHQLWSMQVPWGTERGVQPVSDGTSIYFVKRGVGGPLNPPTGHLTAIDPTDGHQRWSVSASDDSAQLNLAVSDGLVLAIGWCNGPCLRAYHASDGTLAWKVLHGTTDFVTAPTVADGVVYVGDTFGILELDLATGVARGGFPNDWDYQPAVTGGRIFRGEWVYSVATNGKLWYAQYPQQVRVSDGRSMISYESSWLIARDAATGVEEWRAARGCSISQPAVSAAVIVIQGCGKARGLDRNTGAELWSTNLHDTSDLQPVIANGLVYVSVTSRPWSPS